MKRLSLTAAALLLAAPGCYTKSAEAPEGASSFRVELKGIYPADSVPSSTGERTALAVEAACVAQHGNDQTQVPAQKRGTDGCRYVIPRGEVEVELSITALDANGETYTGFNGPLAFRVVPGDLSATNSRRWVQMENGYAEGAVRASHVYGEVRVWVEDAPVHVDYVDGGVRLDTNGGVPVEGQLPAQEPASYSYATGISRIVLFEEPTLAKAQQPDGFDNKFSPFMGQFLKIGRSPEAGAPLLHSCLPDDPNNGKEMKLVVTGTDPSGFFVTDVTSCRIPEVRSGTSIMLEPSGYFPGTYGSMFIYNYNYPEGLDRGDILWTLSGSVTEFSGATQMTFPAWTVRERVRQVERDPNLWEKHIPAPVELNLRTCALSNQFSPFVTDELCAYSNSNVKVESLESALVKVKNVRFPELMVSCDLNGNGEIPFFCQTKDADGNWTWGECPGGTLSANDVAERTCNAECTTSRGAYAGKVCAERTTYTSFGQFVVEMAGPGPAEARLDDSVPERIQRVTVSAAAARTARGSAAGSQLRVWCNVPVRVAFGPSTVTATTADTLLAANTRLEHTVVDADGYASFLAEGATTLESACWVGANARTKISLVTKDAAPELNPDCDPADADATKAEQCRALRAATYDVVGHLRQIQAGRPRWLILPRDAGDLCCYPGEGLSCPKPIKSCQ
ncbi:MAG TPA: hypothetical protein VFO83_12680 [Aggregicoccus sp.]|nr:hypothetical protein [Aggregicoccus sp.]